MRTDRFAASGNWRASAPERMNLLYAASLVSSCWVAIGDAFQSRTSTMTSSASPVFGSHATKSITSDCLTDITGLRPLLTVLAAKSKLVGFRRSVSRLAPVNPIHLGSGGCFLESKQSSAQHL